MRALRMVALTAALSAPGWGCPREDDGVPAGPCEVSITTSLSARGDGGLIKVEATPAGDTALDVAAGEVVNLNLYLVSAFDFQYQSNLAEPDGLVLRSLVPTQLVNVTDEDGSAYVYDVVPVHTAGLAGAFQVNVGAHINVNPERHTCTGPKDQSGRVTVSTWRTMTLRVNGGSSSGGAGSSSSSSSGPASSSGG